MSRGVTSGEVGGFENGSAGLGFASGLAAMTGGLQSSFDQTSRVSLWSAPFRSTKVLRCSAGFAQRTDVPLRV
jgi:hypothetical protein